MSSEQETAARLTTLEAELERAIGFHQAGDLEKAAPIYEQILAQSPTHTDALHLLGVAHHQFGRHEVAADLIGRAIDLSPQSANFHYNLSRVHIALGHLDRAAESLRTVRQLDPHHLDALNDLGNVLAMAGDTKAAVECFLEHVELAPAHPSPYFNLGNLLMDGGDIERALPAFRSAHERAPENVLFRERYRKVRADKVARLLRSSASAFERGDMAGALQGAREAASIAPEEADVQIGLGKYLHASGDNQEASTAIRHAISLRPGSEEAFALLGGLLGPAAEEDSVIEQTARAVLAFRSKKFELAETLARRAVDGCAAGLRRNAEDGGIWAALGLALRSIADAEQAEELLRETLTDLGL